LGGSVVERLTRSFRPVPDNPTAYAKRFDAVLAYIEGHLEGDLSVNTLNEVAHFSVYHFHRQFTAYVGVPVARHVQLMRLRRVAHRLASSAHCPVLDSSLDADFGSPEAFSRAFQRDFAWRQCFSTAAELADLACGFRCSPLFQEHNHAGPYS
jgi:transcriptional regulator GlxA family with amidase domain